MNLVESTLNIYNSEISYFTSISSSNNLAYNSVINLLNCHITLEDSIFFKNIGINGGVLNI